MNTYVDKEFNINISINIYKPHPYAHIRTHTHKQHIMHVVHTKFKVSWQRWSGNGVLGGRG